VILASGRPSLLLPIGWPAERIGRRIVVGWNAGREATAAIAAAMPFLAGAEEVRIVVVPDARTRNLYGADPGADIAQHLARHGIAVTLDQREGEDAGAVLLECCRAVDADMLVMGAVGRSRISEFVFGGATRTVLGATDLPVLLSG
jgi:nucleotide-binding universal stress UspA family protein